jgi:hypothetical protein
MTTPTIPRISWPHVAALGIIVAGVVAVLVLAPDTTVGHILRIVAGVMGLSGAAGTASRGGVVKHEAPPPIRELPGVRTMPARKRSGHADLHTYGLIAVVAIGWALVRGIAHVAHWLGLGVLLLVASGCGGATAEQRTAYAVEQARCLANERAIVDREGTSYELDRYDLEQERARCDAALRVIYQEAP